jgi:hypothetical protein
VSQIQEIHGTDAVSLRKAQRWTHVFADGKAELDSAPRPDRPTKPENPACVRKMIEYEPHISQKTIADRLGIHHETVKRLLRHELGLAKKCGTAYISKSSNSPTFQEIYFMTALPLFAITQVGRFIRDLKAFWKFLKVKRFHAS